MVYDVLVAGVAFLTVSETQSEEASSGVEAQMSRGFQQTISNVNVEYLSSEVFVTRLL